jgi:hypothetical protein
MLVRLKALASGLGEKVGSLRRFLPGRRVAPEPPDDGLLLWNWARWEIRGVDNTFGLPSDSDVDNALIQGVACFLTDSPRNITDEMKRTVEHRGEQLASLRDKTMASEVARGAIAKYLVHDASRYRNVGLDTVADARTKLASTIYPEIQNISPEVSHELHVRLPSASARFAVSLGEG